MSGLEEIVGALGAHEARKAAGLCGDVIEVRCPACAWHAHSYECYATEAGMSVTEAEAWLLLQHECGGAAT